LALVAQVQPLEQRQVVQEVTLYSQQLHLLEVVVAQGILLRVLLEVVALVVAVHLHSLSLQIVQAVQETRHL
jgi:hypothetical protein